MKNLREIGIDTRFVKTVNDTTGIAQITVSDNGKYRFCTYEEKIDFLKSVEYFPFVKFMSFI